MARSLFLKTNESAMSIAHTCFNGFEANFQEPWIVTLLLC